MTDELVKRLLKIADASRREDGSLIPLGEDLTQAADRITALRAEVERLEKAGRCLLPYLHWTIGAESPGHHPTMPSAVADFEATLGAKP